MSAAQYENIRVVLAEPSSHLRSEIVALMHERGFRNVNATGNLAGVLNAVNSGEVDLLIGDTKLPEGDLSDIIHQIRHGKIGHNPFIVAITLLSSSDTTLVHKVMESGTDQIIVKPFHTEEIVGHIENLTHARKAFVVTTDYIGPNRRRQARPGTQEIPLIAVPNPLRSRMTGQISEHSLKRSIGAAQKIINEQKVIRHAYQIGWLMNQIGGTDEDASVNIPYEELNKHLQRLHFVATDIALRIRQTHYAHVAGLCMTLQNMADKIMKYGFDAGDIRMIKQLSRVIQSAFDEKRADVDEYRRNSEREANQSGDAGKKAKRV
jgi:DNA-binding NarL/FixJ family response regulator